MVGLPAELYSRCRTVLLRCHEFDSYSDLRTLFVAEPLFAFRIGIPRADSSADLVDRCMDYLIDKRLSGGHPVLPVFLATLRDRYIPGNELRDDLQALYEAVEDSMAQPAPKLVQAPHHGQQLFDSLLKLDFGEQVKRTKQVIQAHRIAAFLVHGETDCGQQLLVNRLIRLSPGWQTGQRICIDAGSNGTGKSSHSLWRHLASKMNLPVSTPPAQIADKVCEWWKTQDVIFVFHTVDYIPPTILAQWVQEFWQPLVTATQLNAHLAQADTHLLMFLVDYSGCTCNSDFKIAQQADQPDFPHFPLHLPPASRFPPNVLDVWLDMSAELLPIGITTQTLLESSDNGIPQRIYEIICDNCEISWEGDLAKWLV